MAERRISDKSCSGCHSKFKPLAFDLKNYNGNRRLFRLESPRQYALGERLAAAIGSDWSGRSNALAILADRVRFGSLNLFAAGERIRRNRDYVFNGEKRFHFVNKAQRNPGGCNTEKSEPRGG